MNIVYISIILKIATTMYNRVVKFWRGENYEWNNKVSHPYATILISREENEFGMTHNLSWKGYNFDILNELSEENFTTDIKKSKHIGIIDEKIAINKN